MNRHIFLSHAFIVLLLAVCTLSLCGQDLSNPDQQIRNFIKIMETNKDSIDLNLYLMIKDIYNLGSNSYHYRIRPLMIDGGGGSYSNYAIQSDLKKFLHEDYSCEVTPSVIKFGGVSHRGYGSITAEIDSFGVLRFISVTGKFKDKLK